jgi:hypothetical protein
MPESDRGLQNVKLSISEKNYRKLIKDNFILPHYR